MQQVSIQNACVPAGSDCGQSKHKWSIWPVPGAPHRSVRRVSTAVYSERPPSPAEGCCNALVSKRARAREPIRTLQRTWGMFQRARWTAVELAPAWPGSRKWGTGNTLKRLHQ